MSAHLYIAQHEVEGYTFMSPCVGDDELFINSRMAEHFGARLIGIIDLEAELNYFMASCSAEGQIRGWDLGLV